MILNDFLEVISNGGYYLPSEFDVLLNPERNALLYSIVPKLLKERQYWNILEVGSRGGGSALMWIEMIRRFNNGHGHLTCVDIADRAPGKEMKAYRHIFEYNVSKANAWDMVTTIYGDSRSALPLLQGNIYNLVYIDGSHKCSMCLSDLAMAKILVRVDGFILGDDLCFQMSDPGVNAEEIEKNAEYEGWPPIEGNKHPGVALALHQAFNGADMKPLETLWGIDGMCFRPLDLRGIGADLLLPIPEYFPEWAVRIAQNRIKYIDWNSHKSAACGANDKYGEVIISHDPYPPIALQKPPSPQ